MRGLPGDLRLAVRNLRKQKGFSVAAIAALALGIGSNTAIFSVIHAVLLSPLPFPQPDRLVSLLELQPGLERASISAPDYRDLERQGTSFAHLSAFIDESIALSTSHGPQRLPGLITTPGFFQVLGVQPVLGRAYQPTDGRACLAVASLGLWQRQFGGDRSAVGRSLTLDGQRCTLVGVLAASDPYPSRVELWVSHGDVPTMRGSSTDSEQRGSHYLQVIGRLRQGVALPQAQKELRLVAARLAKAYPATNEGHVFQVFSLHEDLVRQVSHTLWALLASVGFVLLVAAANVASLQLARATMRGREMVTRVALGATRAQLVRQLLVENIVLALIGALVGLLLAVWGIDLLNGLLKQQLPVVHAASLDLPVLAFTLGLAVVSGLLFGIVPALSASRTAPAEILHAQGRVSAGRGRARRVLVATEIALALALSSGAGLLARSFLAVSQVTPGFQSTSVYATHVAAPESRLGKPDSLAVWYDELLTRLRAVPGVESVGAIVNLPLEGSNRNGDFIIEGRPQPGSSERWLTEMQVVSPGYFEAMRIPIVFGRALSAGDRRGGQHAVVVNQAFTRRFFPGQSAVGHRISYDNTDPQWMEIVGVVGDVHQFNLAVPPLPEVYEALQQAPEPGMSLVVRERPGARGVAAAVRVELEAFDPEQAAGVPKPMEDLLTRSLGQRRVAMFLWTVFAAMGLLLVLVGVYGVMSYTVAQRTREIGIRMALGAQPVSVLRLVVGDGARTALVGLGVGVGAALLVARIVRGLVFGVSAHDPTTLALAALAVLAVALGACGLPAWRGTRVDPMVALRNE
jgi:predicted permease